ncbi:MAG: dienelactone hydrolase family protein, partial [Verrucomicrobiota bacterium]|nr:dienelactone hydrolase family protein [Verrucomicrobiota bacterium]
MRAHADDDSIRTRRAKFESGGKPVNLEIFARADDAKHPAVIVLHGAGGIWLDGRVVREFASRLAGHGYTALVVHYFERTGTSFANDEKIFAHFQEWRTTISDAVTFATQQPEVDGSKVGLFGYSLGAFLSLAEAALDTRVG